MNLPAICIRRPAFTIVISLVLVIIGVIGFNNLPVRWIPNVTPPEVSITTMYTGANARSVEQDVTKVIEDGLSGINGIESIKSVSRQGGSQITIDFKLGRNMDAAVEDVRSSLERVRGDLPKDVMNPTVSKQDPNNDAILYISFYDAHRSEQELSDYLDKFITPSLETIDGVGSVWVYGKRVSAMRVWLDPAKMAAANVTVDEVSSLLHDQNASIPSGQIRGYDRYYSVVMDTSLKTPEQFGNTIIRDNQNQVVRLKDISDIRLDPEEIDSSFRIGGRPGIAIGIVPQSTANPLEVEKQVKQVFASLKRGLPAGMEANIIYNQADYIRGSIHSVYESFFEAVIFVWLVIFAFLCNFRATIVPVITIPVCIISSFSILYFFGFSINTITLMAFVLAIGLVVDDAIVMLENISRHMEEGLTAFAAALKGSREIVFPVIAMTITLAAVYTPIAFSSGLMGVLFREFTFTLAGAVIISGIIALTLSPMMCARLLKPNQEGGRYQTWLNAKLSALQYHYSAILNLLLQKRRWVLAALCGVMLLGYGVYKFMGSELTPQEDMGSIYVSVAAPRSASFLYTENYVKQLEGLYNKIPELSTYLSMSGMSSPARAFQILMLKPSGNRHRSTQEVVAELSAQVTNIPGVRVHVFMPPSPLAEVVSSDFGGGMGIVLKTSNDYRRLQQVSAQMMDNIKKSPDFSAIDNNLKWDTEMFQVNIDRDRAADLRVPIPSITNTLSVLLAGRNIGKVNTTNIYVQMNQAALANPNIFQQLYVRNSENNMVPLGSLLSVNEASTPEVFRHTDRLRSDSISMDLDPKLKMADAVKELQTIAKNTLPEDVKYSFIGEAKSYLEASGKTGMTFFLALVFIYLVLVAQFESFIDPFIILLTVPFAVVGAMLTLKLFGGTLNIYSEIGLITLVGLIAKHGILITDFANRLRLSGKSIHEAVVEAAMLRLRPILMTTASMVLGAIPLAIAFGPGAENREQIGLVITGGLLFGTFFSLIVVPIAYSYFSAFRKLTPPEHHQDA